MDECIHDWRIEMYYHDETFDFQARCKECDRVDAPDVVNEQIERLQAEQAERDARTCATYPDLGSESCGLARILARDREVRRRALEWQKEHGDPVEGLASFLHNLVGDDPEDIERWEELVDEPY